jgi:hypothetical protein
MEITTIIRSNAHLVLLILPVHYCLYVESPEGLLVLKVKSDYYRLVSVSPWVIIGRIIWYGRHGFITECRAASVDVY